MDLLIVEDEPRLRSNLAHNIAWEEHGIDVVGMAASGEEAMDHFLRKKPDLVLLDIQMPGMSGLELAEWIRKKDSLVKMIVLSGHDSFEFAQQALELGIGKYLLKPAGDKEIKEAVLAAADELRQQLDALHNQALLQQKWSQHLPFLREMFLFNLLQGNYSGWEIGERGKDVHFDMTEPRLYCVAVIDMDPLPAEETRFSVKDASLLQFSVKSIAKESLECRADWVISAPNGGTAIIFVAEGHTDDENADAFHQDANALLQEVNASVGKLLTIIKECLKLTASAGISSCAHEPGKLPGLYEQARHALQKRILYGNHIAITYHDRYEAKHAAVNRPDLEKELEIAIETGNGDKALCVLDTLWGAVMDELSTVEQVHEGVLYFNSLFIRFIQQKGCSVKEVAGDDMVYLQNMGALTTKDQLRACLTRVLRNFIAHLDRRRGAAGHKMVEAILLLIEEHLHEDVTLHSMAEQLYINSSYLSRLFKQETGKSFSSYVMERKMELAKAALLNGAKVYDASASVGYRDVSYFTKVFRKYWGITPGEAAKNGKT